MAEKTIYLVEASIDWSETTWTECAFDTKEKAQKYIDDYNKQLNNMSEELYNKVADAVGKEEEKVDNKYYESLDMDSLRPGMSEDEYNKEYDEWVDGGRRKFVEDTFGVSYDDFLIQEDKASGNLKSYYITETKLYTNEHT